MTVLFHFILKGLRYVNRQSRQNIIFSHSGSKKLSLTFKKFILIIFKVKHAIHNQTLIWLCTFSYCSYQTLISLNKCGNKRCQNIQGQKRVIVNVAVKHSHGSVTRFIKSRCYLACQPYMRIKQEHKLKIVAYIFICSKF